MPTKTIAPQELRLLCAEWDNLSLAERCLAVTMARRLGRAVPAGDYSAAVTARYGYTPATPDRSPDPRAVAFATIQRKARRLVA